MAGGESDAVTIIRRYDARDFDGVDQLWRAVFPDDPPRNRAEHAIPAKLAVGDDLFWVALDGDEAIIGTIMAGWDGHRGWLYSVATDPHRRREGVGRLLVTTALDALRERGCGKVNLQIRAGNEQVQAFYAKLGFSIEPRISMGMTIERDPSEPTSNLA